MMADTTNTYMGDGWVILWRPADRNEWELWKAQKGGVTQIFVPASPAESRKVGGTMGSFTDKR